MAQPHTPYEHPAAIHTAVAAAKAQNFLVEAIDLIDNARAWARAAGMDIDRTLAIDGARTATLRAFRLVDPDTDL